MSFRSGFAAVVGRPNVGKSTLVNRLVGHKISIVSPRPQTTRHRVLGIRNETEAQTVYIDTPGVQEQSTTVMNRMMNRVARAAVFDVDCVVLVIAAQGWTEADRVVLRNVTNSGAPVLLVLNKMDLLARPDALLPLIQQSQAEGQFAEIVPVSAERGTQTEHLAALIRDRLPEHPAYFDDEQVTDRSDRFRAGELVREQLFLALGAEVPYACAVEIERFGPEEGRVDLMRVEAIIWLEREGQKGIVIGKDGSRLKEIGRRARLEMQALFGMKVFLGLWVRVRADWADDSRVLARLGYGDESS